MAGRTLQVLPDRIVSRGTPFGWSGIQASAIKLDPEKKKGEDALPPEKPEHRVAWNNYDQVGEVGQIVSASAGVLAQCEFYPGFIDTQGEERRLVDADGKPAEGFDARFVADCHAVMARFVDQAGAQRGLIRAQAECFHVVGDSYLVGWYVGTDGKPIDSENPETVTGARERWEVVARSSIETKQSRYRLRLNRQDTVDLPAHAVAFHMWRRHPRYPDEARAWVVSTADAITDLRIFTLAQRSAGRSSVPADVTVVAAQAEPRNPVPLPPGPAGPGPPASGAQAWAQRIEKLIGDAVLEVLRDAQSGRAIVGPVLAVDEKYVKDGFASISLHRDVDTGLQALVDQARRRIVEASDSSPEMLFGLGETNRWNGAQIDDTEYRRYFRPLGMDIADAWTLELLWGGLLTKGHTVEDVRRVRVLVDASGVVADPDLSKNATDGLRSFAIGRAAWRRANGFNDDDAPDEAEEAFLVAAFAKPAAGQSGQDGPPAEPSEVQAAARPTTRRLRAVGGDLGRAMLGVEQDTRGRLEEACEAALDQAVARAGAKLRNWSKKDRELLAVLGPLPAGQVPGRLGPDRCVLLAADQFPGDQQRREDMFLAAVAVALAAAFRIFGRAYGTVAGLVGASVPAEEIAANQIAAEHVLRQSMLDLADRTVFDPIKVPDLGELSGLRVPQPVIRRTLSAAGGAPVGPGLEPIESYAGGFIGGPAVQSVLPSQIGWTWEYGTAPRANPFPEHVALSGVEFDTIGDSVLGGLYPGDHAGCQCDLEPRYTGDD